MKNRIPFIIITLLIVRTGYSQTGSAGNPFISLGQARNITGTGVYYFNLGGTTFSTTIKNGWVLIANDFGLTTTVLSTTNALSTAVRGILTPGILATLTSTSMLKVSTSDGNVNDSSGNASLISRMTHDSTLNLGSPDIAINATWVGSGIYANNVRGAGATATSTSAGVHLDSCIFWPNGDVNGFHWITASGGYHREDWNAGEVPATVAFDLWVEAPLVTLPILLSNFQGYQVGNTVKLVWTSDNEVNSNYIIVQRSTDGTNWSELASQKAQGNSDVPTSYSEVDNNPFVGANYYRLKMVDLDGQATYSQVIVINFSSGTAASMFPNPSSGVVSLKGANLAPVTIYTLTGQNVSSQVKMVTSAQNMVQLDLSKLSKGFYLIKANNFIAIEQVE